MKVPLDDLENSKEIQELLELLPVLREIAEKYKNSKRRTSVLPRRRTSESKFIRSFRKKDQ